MDAYFMYISSKLEKLRKGHHRRVCDMGREIISLDLWQGALAECIGTMLFVFVSTASIVFPIGESLDSAKIVKVAFTFGLMICVVIQMFGHVSGGHMNPAVTVGMLFAFQISPLRAILYVIAQCGGGLLGSLILKSVSPSSEHNNLGYNDISAVHDIGQGIACEAVFTFILVFSVLGCTDEHRPFFGSPALGIGLTVGVLHLALIPITGGGINPARTLGPALLSDHFNNHWIFWAGPMGGAIVAAILYKLVFNPYRGELSVEDASRKLLTEDDVIVIPKTYFKDHGLKAELHAHFNHGFNEKL